MVNIPKLKGKIIENGFSIESLADAINMHRATLYRKMSAGGETFLIKEAGAISETLKLSSEEASAIFFSHIVA